MGFFVDACGVLADVGVGAADEVSVGVAVGVATGAEVVASGVGVVSTRSGAGANDAAVPLAAGW